MHRRTAAPKWYGPNFPRLECWAKNIIWALPRALASLQQIKVGELHLDGKTVHVTTRPTDSHAAMLRCLGLPAMPKRLGEAPA